MANAQAPVQPGWLGLLRRYAVQAAVLLPAVVWVAAREWVQWRQAGLGRALPPALSPASDPVELLRTMGFVLVACLAFASLAWWLVRKPGPVRSRLSTSRFAWGLLAVWVALWLAGAAQAVRSQFNVEGVQAPHTETLKLVGLRVTQPTKRSLGGAQLYLEWPAQGGLHTVVIESPSPELLREPPTVQLQVAAGRWHGWYVLDWAVLEPAPQTGLAATTPPKATP